MADFLSEVVEQLLLFSQDNVQAGDVIDLLRVAPVEDLPKKVDSLSLLLQLLSHDHKLQVLLPEGLQIHVASETLSIVDSECRVEQVNQVVVLVFLLLDLGRDSVLEELECVVDASVLEVRLGHGGEVGVTMSLILEHALLKQFMVRFTFSRLRER